MSNKYPSKVSELGDGEVYAILYPESTTIPGDERSRTNPGHGYPEHSIDYWKIETFTTKEAWLAEINRLAARTYYYQSEYKACIMRFPKITKQVIVDVN